ncbi:MAG: helix-turn-helix transcriptional regulator [Halobacteriota archaeon]|nr:helix-turn-helix transcriptional regulator [Halobacteriota archaeon]
MSRHRSTHERARVIEEVKNSLIPSALLCMDKKELAKAIGVHRGLIDSWMNGKYAPSDRNLKALEAIAKGYRPKHTQEEEQDEHPQVKVPSMSPDTFRITIEGDGIMVDRDISREQCADIIKMVL